MITVFPHSRLPNHSVNRLKSWQEVLRDAITDAGELCELLELPQEFRENAQQVSSAFALKVPRGFAAKMKLGDTRDPLLRQVLPLKDEHLRSEGYQSDPVADLSYNPKNGIIHKYHGRVLLITTGACAVHCRYCFRREFPYNEQVAAKKQWQTAINYISNDSSIHEVILSGGDPLSLSDSKLETLILALNEIKHVKTLRFHTRQPIVLPERIDDNFITTLKLSHKKIVFVLHANHANELCDLVKISAQRLRFDVGASLLNQAVLLKGVNDSAETLIALSHALHQLNILPYYLNLLDKVNGSQHFHVGDECATALYKTLLKSLPGYLVPKLVRDDSNNLHKTHLSNVYKQ